MCNMAKLESDASKVPECADALEANFEDEESSCRCWEAVSEEYREENFRCRTDSRSPMTVMDLYEYQCVDSEESSSMDDGNSLHNVIHLV